MIPPNECTECGSKTLVAGPLWCGKIQNKAFCEVVRAEVAIRYPEHHTRLLNLTTTILEEADAPASYYKIDEICDRLNIPNPSFKRLFEALRAHGFSAYRTHFHPKALKTDAPALELERIIAA